MKKDRKIPFSTYRGMNRLVTAEWTFKKHGSTYSCVLTEKL